MTMDKTYASAAEDVADIPSGAALAEGGLGLSGNSIPLIDAVLASGPADLSVASNNGSVDGWGSVCCSMPGGSPRSLRRMGREQGVCSSVLGG